jgi:predicted oxidoreductase
MIRWSKPPAGCSARSRATKTARAVGRCGQSDMAIDHVDVLLIPRSDPLMDHRETGAALDDLGKIAPLTNGDAAFHQRLMHPLMVWSPLGALMDEIAADNIVDRSAVAAAWLLAHPAQLLPVLGTTNLARISRISDALKIKMDRSTWVRLYQ